MRTSRLASLLSCFTLVMATSTTSALHFDSGDANTATPQYGFKVVAAYPHDRNAFTQGLIFRDNFLYESTGRYGASTLRKIELETGKVLSQRKLPDQIFGEGIVDFDNDLVWLTWTSGFGAVFDLNTFAVKKQFQYTGEGWGLTRTKDAIVMSDGTAQLRFLDPNSLQEIRRIKVSDHGKPVTQLNELEMVEGEIFANIWQTDFIARIDPDTGKVKGWINLKGLLPQSEMKPDTDVLNGIAYDPVKKRLFVTGKLWPKVFEIEIQPSTN
ncbi:glutaminyl-peptide cyclotransferase [Undibacterium cyanobacteriorum]|uniref:Glutaminyl-peptide cyclotransferase n=1 Tax=Undibacterium cyanobacteriorum TaxID=3073561 RepID=A0ABY9RIW7_9BURK|nr:glutaminyl-peptide cyclotransferase [Undibacterium sp. 20NA77.5]WMW80610.1 glutaminyl-peptide cyclotransferase [Undibacterium sp. 20NA77.5]